MRIIKDAVLSGITGIAIPSIDPVFKYGDCFRAAGAAQVYAEAAPKGVAHPVGESDRSGEGEAGGELGEGEHI